MSKKFYIFLIIMLVASLVTSISYIIINYKKDNEQKEIFEELEEIRIENKESDEQEKGDIDLQKLYELNNDFIGWLKIENTNINYPIMQNENYYLHRNIYKKYSSRGTPYLAEYCNLRTSNNLIIYGHHMNDNSMFAELVNYKNYNYYKNHKYIYFYTLRDGQTIKNTYEIVTAFKTIAYSDNGFKYYNYTNFYNEQEFNSFIENCRNLEFYNTDVNLKYGDKLITLSTCEYSQKNGRMVIIAKKI